MIGAMRSHAVFAILVVSCALGVGCGGAGADALGPTPVDPTGEWSMTWTETSNTCAPIGAPATYAVLLGLTANGTRLVWQDEGDLCDSTGDFVWTGSDITLSATDQFIGNDGCLYSEEITTNGHFTSTTFTSALTTAITRLSGTNCTDYIANPCVIHESVTGARCQGCYGGCL